MTHYKGAPESGPNPYLGPSTIAPHYGPSSPQPQYGPSTISPHFSPYGPSTPHYGPSTKHYFAPAPSAEPLFFSDLTNVHFTTLEHGDSPKTSQPVVHVKHQGQSHHSNSKETKSPSGPTPYKYKIIDDVKPSYRELPERKLTVPSKGYLPPKASDHKPDHKHKHNEENKKHLKSHHHREPSHKPPSQKHKQHLESHHKLKAYIPPVPELKHHPKSSYLPPSPDLTVPHKSYLPPPEPKPKSIQYHSKIHSPTIANLNEVHTLPSLEKIKHHAPHPIKHVSFPPSSDELPEAQPIFEPKHYQPKAFIGPQLPPQQSIPQPPPPPKAQYSIEGNHLEYSNKDKLQEALKNFNARPNIDREASLSETLLSNEDIEVLSIESDAEKSERLLASTIGLQITTAKPNVEVTTAGTIGTTRINTNVERLSTTPRRIISSSTTPVPITQSSSVSPSSTLSPIRIDEFLPEVQQEEVIILDGRDSNDNILFGPKNTKKPESTSKGSLIFSTPKPSVEDSVKDLVLGKFMHLHTYILL